MNNLDDVKKKIEEVRDFLTKVDTDERKEIKKNNKVIMDYLELFNDVRNVLLGELRNKYNLLIKGINYDFLDNSKKIDGLREEIKNNSNNGFIYKLDFDRYLYDIRYSNNLDIINGNIIKIMNKLVECGVVLKKEDFNYSLSLYKYMDCFFEYINKDEFKIKIKDTFDDLYWECPNLVSHIYLSLVLILDKNEDKINNYLKTINDGKNLEEIVREYNDEVIKRDNSVNVCEGIIFDKFVNGELRVDDYLFDNESSVINKFIEIDKYNEFTLEERDVFYNDIEEMYHNLYECRMINKYKVLIDRVMEIYTNKDKYKNSYIEFKNKVKDLDKKRSKFIKKLFSVNKRILDGKKWGISKYSSLFNLVNSSIDEIIDLYKEYDWVLFVNDIMSKLNDDSTYYEVFKLYENNYSYFRVLVDNIDDKAIDEYDEFLSSPYLEITKSIPFLKDFDVLDKIREKYVLNNIDISNMDMDSLFFDLEYLVRVKYFRNLDIEKIKLIIDISKIIK